MESLVKKSKDERDMDDFLSRVNEVESIMRGFKTDDDSAVKRADEFIAKQERKQELLNRKRGVDRTVINDPSPNTSGSAYTDPNTAGFMAAMEQDCKERAERRRKNEEQAEKWKQRGNEKFRAERYEEAVKLYSKGLEIVRYMSTLYTNRAQALIKLQRYNEALEDCGWALRAEKQCLKAYVLKAKAYIGLKDYTRAREAYSEALEAHPSKEKLITEYQTQLRLTEEAELEEKCARNVFSLESAGDQTLSDVLNKLKIQDQPVVYYIGGLAYAKSLIKSANDKVYLRAEGFLHWSVNHPVISKYEYGYIKHEKLTSCRSVIRDLFADDTADTEMFSNVLRRITRSVRYMSEKVSGLSDTGSEFCSVYIDLLRTACVDCETNTEELVKQANLLQKLSDCFTECRQKNLKMAAINLLSHLSADQRNQSHIITHCNLTRLVEETFILLKTDSLLFSMSLQMLNTLNENKRFRLSEPDALWRTITEQLSPVLFDDGADVATLASALLFLQNCSALLTCVLSGESDQFSHGLLHRLKVYEQDPQSSTDVSTDLVCSILTFLTKFSIQEMAPDTNHSDQLTEVCCHLVNKTSTSQDVNNRALLLLSKQLQQPAAVTAVCNLGIVPTLLSNLLIGNEEPTVKLSLQCLTACSKVSEDVRRVIVATPKGMGSVVKLLMSTDESVVGNAALCLGHCVITVSGASKALANTDVIKDLLLLARDAARPAVQHNCAILIAKLAAADKRHLARLRELHGLEILHTVLNHVPQES